MPRRRRGTHPAGTTTSATLDLSAVTLDLLLAHVTGRLEPGLAADLLLVQGNLERDITALQRRDAVFIRGKPLPA